ncbi:O-fucosyltransferase 10-like isoform X2 [Magnolia sinica]|uniref:O-fucosyltransferase 10-like isoform X2 n=1 Tax=Magnolia sinica TaxID=86752 RepID=UPI002658DA77|nr:O-fucosyltransferase 10-like isoform X2 [Magnolia sinica]
MKTKTYQNHLTNGSSSESSSPSPSPPSSPHRPSRAPQCRRRHRSKAHATLDILVGFLFRRRIRVFVLLPLFYISGILMCAGTFSIIGRPQYLPGSLYRSGKVFQELWPKMQLDNASAIQLSTVWKHGRRLKEQIRCTNSTDKPVGSQAPSGYLVVEANGGLNQQRSSICNAVAVAGLLNAILVIPQFNFHSIWKDPRQFEDIYDEDHFIKTLQGHVRVVRELPEILMERYGYNISNIPNFRVNAWASAGYYLGSIYPVLRAQGVIRISPFANRLAMKVPSNIQCLRCLANYQALRFSTLITTLAKELVSRMIKKSSGTGGKYVSVHLRFEEDMVAFSCCEYDGGETEKKEMKSARERGWKGKFNRQDRIIRPGLNRLNGRCPLSPLEVGMMLRGMGFDNNTSIYLASGKIYHAERNLAPLLQMFPHLQTKESLATAEELSSFKGYSSRLAALDYTVCLFSEVFVTTQGGNFPHFLMGHRRHLYDGHAKTIKPDKRKMVLLLHNTSLSWEVFKHEMEAMLDESDRKGIALRKPKGSIYAHPSPECTCCRGSINLAHLSGHPLHSIHLP